jgi:hypothetical protein
MMRYNFIIDKCYIKVLRECTLQMRSRDGFARRKKRAYWDFWGRGGEDTRETKRQFQSVYINKLVLYKG